MWFSDVSRAVVELVDPRPGETVVDIGAGFGPAAVVIARRGAAVVGVDPTPSMRRVLSLRRQLAKGRNRIQVVAGAAEQLPLPDGSADVVISVNTMHHWADPGQAVAEIARVLGPGGRLVLADEAFDDPTHPNFDPTADQQHHDRDDFLDVDPGELADRLAAAGLVDARGEHRRMGGAPVKLVTATKAQSPDRSPGQVA